jgi:SAM-dependent methyltransferase
MIGGDTTSAEELREQRLVFGEDAALYDRVRPSYPEELIDDVLGLAGLLCRAVDAGCGTGKAAVLLAARGAEGIGIEPDAAMAEVARRKLAAHPRWRVDVSDFEDWKPRNGDVPVDLVTCAQAWHWLDRERGTRQAERLLRPGGWLAIWGHEPEYRDSPLRRQIDAAYARYAPRPSVRSQAPRERVPPGSSFGAPVEREYRGWRDYSAAEWMELMRTSSDHKVLPAERREPLLAAVAEAIEAHGGTYRHHHVCRLWAARRTRAR